MRTAIRIASMLTCACGVQTSLSQVFPDTITLTAGDNAKDVIAVDVNRDGVVDLAAANRDADSLTVFLNNGSGVFVPGVALNFAALARPFAIASADFNGDGNPDLAVALQADDQVAVLTGSAVGIFSQPALFGVGDSPRDVATGDFNNDGNADIATANREDDTVSILLGNGDGTFGNAISVMVRDDLRAQPEGIALGDFNGDGNLDFAVTRSFINQMGVGVSLGDGAGGFGALSEVATGRDPRGIVAADIDGDTNLDLAVSNNDSKDVSILLGAGDGTFASAGEFATGQNGNEALAVGDIDGDTNLDVVVANREGDNVSVLLGDGSGSLGAAAASNTGNAPVAVALANIDGDGKLDVITANEEDDSVSILLSSGFVPVDLIDTVAPGCNSGCGPAGMMPVLFTLCGIVGLRRASHRMK